MMAESPSSTESTPAPTHSRAAPLDPLDAHTQKIARHIAGRQHISRNPHQEYEARIDWGQRAADAVAKFGGSWRFIGLFAAVLVGWVILNSVILARHAGAFDPYPYILLNLFLSMLASIQAPIILMSQNRHAEIDRIHAEHDYEVNLKAELEIMLLHEKMDLLREGQWQGLVAMQQKQIDILQALLLQAHPK